MGTPIWCPIVPAYTIDNTMCTNSINFSVYNLSYSPLFGLALAIHYLWRAYEVKEN